jgi:hypothetical protein
MLRSFVVTASCLCALGASAAEPVLQRDPVLLEKEFSEKLSGATLVGMFSIDGKEGTKAERYEISSAKKLQGCDWVITARVKYGDKDVNLPMVMQVFWADDTPVITLTDRTIPGLGTFTARVMFHGHRYVGTWQHDKVGGHMWGTVEKNNKEEKPAEKKD